MQTILRPSVQFHIPEPTPIPEHVETPQYEEEVSGAIKKEAKEKEEELEK